MAKIVGRFMRAAFSIATAERVSPPHRASAATSSSDIKLYTSAPSFKSSVLLIPYIAIFVSVTMQTPFCKSLWACSTTPGENTKLSA